VPKIWALAAVVWFSAIGTVWSRTRAPGLIVYSLAIATLVWVLARVRLPQRAQFLLLAFISLVGLAALFVTYPKVNVHGRYAGSDADDALNLAVRALLAGRYPYEQETYLGNPIAPLPGAVLFALPFVIVFGSSAYQALAWWPAFAWRLRRSPDDWFTVLIVTLASVEVWHSLVTGSDGFVNGIYVALLSLAVLDKPTLSRAAVWGVSLSSRALMLPVAPLVILALAERDRRGALRASVVATCAFCVITFPFYLWSPSQFSPIQTGSKLTLQGTLSSPAFGIAVVVCAFAIAVALLRRVGVASAASLALGIPVLILTFVFVALRGTQGLGYTSYAIEVLPFVAFATVNDPSARRLPRSVATDGSVGGPT
jgi:hypothetical protein